MALSKEASEFVDKLMDSRGGILMAFAQVEWYLAKLIVEAAAYDEYKALDLSFSQDAEKRAERLKKILNVDGPFSPYADALNKSLDTVIAHVQLRTMSAHGLVVRPDPEDLSLSSKLYLRMFRMYKGGELQEEKIDLTLKQYSDQSSELSGAARQFVATARKIWSDLGFKDLEPK